MVFLGLINVSEKSAVIAALAGISQFFQARLAGPKTPDKKAGGLGADFQRSLSLQMKYVFPVLIFFIAWSISAAVALYWTTSNVFMIGQELYARRNSNQKNKNGQNG